MKKLLSVIFLSVLAFSVCAQTKINPAKLLQGQSGGGSLFLKTDNSGSVSFSNNLNGSVISGAGNASLNGDLVNFSQVLSGSINYIQKITASGQLGNTSIFDNGTNIGIETVAPNGKLTIIKNSIYNNESLGGIYLKTGEGATNIGLIIGTDKTNNIAFIQSIEPGTSYGSKGLSINPNGANVGIRLGAASAIYPLQVGGGIGATYFDGTGAISTFHSIKTGSFASQYGALITAKSPTGNSIEFGHSDVNGFASTLGAYNATGYGFLAFSGGRGTNNNTFKTFGLRASILRGDNAGGWVFENTASTNADNQTADTRVIINNVGNITARDIIANRGDGTGTVFLNAANNRFLQYDGTNYVLNSATLNMTSNKIINGAAGIASTDYIIKSQLDLVASNIAGTANTFPIFTTGNSIGNSGITWFNSNGISFSGTRAAPNYIYARGINDDASLKIKAGSSLGYFSEISIDGSDGSGVPSNINFKTSGVDVARLHNSGNFTIGTIVDYTGKMQIIKNSSYNSEFTTGLYLSSGMSATNTGLILGTDKTNNIAYIQSIEPGTTYGSKNISLQAMGGKVFVGGISGNEKFNVVGNIAATGTISAANPFTALHVINLQSGDARYLGITATATNSGALNGQNGFYYRNASNINSGTLADAQLSTNVPLLNADNTFSGKMAIGGAINSSFNLTVTGSGLFSSNLTVNSALTANTASVTGAATSTTNTQLWSVGASGALEKMNISSLQFEPLGVIAKYSPHTVSAFTADIGGGVLKHILTLDCENFYMRTFRVNISNVSSLGARITFTNAKPGGLYTINYFNGNGNNIFYEQAKKQDGTTDFGTFTVSGMATHRFSYDQLTGTGFIQAF
jgi:hypothetical protein